MKGLTHFWTGVCIATFFPFIVTAAYDPSRLLLTLLIPIGGIFGYLPDFLDFKLSRYIEPTNKFITPGYKKLDPWIVAKDLVDSINAAYSSKKPVRVKLQTIKMPNGLWRRYSVRFLMKTHEVEVKIGPLITTGLEVLEGTEPQEEKIAIMKYKPRLYYSYESVTNVDIWDGPTFQFRREGDTVYADFIQWHRRWSHSLTLGLLMGFLIAGAAAILYKIQNVTLSDLDILIILGVVTGGMWGHVIVDQLGWLGSNLFWPITGKRKRGLGLTRSMDPFANFITIYILTMLIFWNLNRFAPEPVFLWTNFEFFVYFMILPIAIISAATYAYRKKKA
ncbi:MAG: metal-dependent hydrolase, partial [Promethearchaeota archaeon]